MTIVYGLIVLGFLQVLIKEAKQEIEAVKKWSEDND